MNQNAMKLGLSSYTYGWEVGVEGYPPAKPLTTATLLERTRDFGLTVLQVADNLDLGKLDDGELDRVAGQAADAGVELEVGMRGLTVDRVLHYASVARRLNSTILRAVIDRTGYEPPLKQVIEICRSAAPELGDVILAIENHDRFPARAIKELMEQVDSPNVRVCLDTANSLGAGEGCQAVLDTLAPWVVNLHIKPINIQRIPSQMGFLVQGCVAGKGCIDIPNVLATLRPIGQCRTVILEQWVPWDGTLENTIARETAWAVESICYLQSLLG